MIISNKIINFLSLPGSTIEYSCAGKESYLNARDRGFEIGRLLAADLLAKKGIRDFSLKRGLRGEPLWPLGLIGSITHKNDRCIVLIAERSSSFHGVGIDLENRTHLPLEMIPLICSNKELSQIKKLPFYYGICWYQMMFSAKESLYKSVSALIKSDLDFRDADVNFNIETHGISFDFPALRELGLKATGKFEFDDEYIFTGTIITGA